MALITFFWSVLTKQTVFPIMLYPDLKLIHTYFIFCITKSLSEALATSLVFGRSKLGLLGPIAQNSKKSQKQIKTTNSPKADNQTCVFI